MSPAPATVLIAEDDPDITEILRLYLDGAGYRVLTAPDGVAALERMRQAQVSVALVDLMMPRMNGYDFIREARKISTAPIIIVSARNMPADKVLGLDVGADGYITKPFDPMEVLARVRSQLRRYTSLGSANASQDVITIGAVSLDDPAKTVTVDGEPVSLTPSEYGILRLLMQHPGQVFSSAKIYESVWNETGAGSESAVAVHIRHLREKIEINPSEPRYIKVVWGQGYKFAPTGRGE